MGEGTEMTQRNAGRVDAAADLTGTRARAGREDYTGAREQSALDTLRNDQNLMEDEFEKEGELVSANRSGTVGAGDTDDAIAAARAQIEDTRSHLSDTIDALKDKLAPAHLAEEAKEAAISKAHDAVSSVVDSVKDKASSVVDAMTGAYHAASDRVADLAQGIVGKVSGHHDTEIARPAQPTLTFYKSGNNNLGATIVDTIKLNPVPAVIAGFGLGWLLLSMQRQQSASASLRGYGDDLTPRDIYDDEAYGSGRAPMGIGNMAAASQYSTASNPQDGPGLRDRASDLAQNVTGKASDLAQNVSGKASDLAHNVGDKASDLAQGFTGAASDLAHSVSDKASGLAQTVTGKASDLKDRASDWAGGVRDSAGQFKDKAGDTVYNFAGQTKAQAGAAVGSTQQFVNEQPLAAAAVALLIGTAIGLAIPATRKENQVLGPQRDRLVDQGKDAAQNVGNKVQTVASVALGQARDSISQTVDQTKHQLSDTVEQTKHQLSDAMQQTKQQLQDTVQHAKDTVISEAQNQGLTSSAS